MKKREKEASGEKKELVKDLKRMKKQELIEFACLQDMMIRRLREPPESKQVQSTAQKECPKCGYKLQLGPDTIEDCPECGHYLYEDTTDTEKDKHLDQGKPMADAEEKEE